MDSGLFDRVNLSTPDTEEGQEVFKLQPTIRTEYLCQTWQSCDVFMEAASHRLDDAELSTGDVAVQLLII